MTRGRLNLRDGPFSLSRLDRTLRIRTGYADFWCERGDSNPHGFTRQILSLVRLPIPPLSHGPRQFKYNRSVPPRDLIALDTRSCRRTSSTEP